MLRKKLYFALTLSLGCYTSPLSLDHEGTSLQTIFQDWAESARKALSPTTAADSISGFLKQNFSDYPQSKVNSWFEGEIQFIKQDGVICKLPPQ
jgi:hypothetical protein